MAEVWFYHLQRQPLERALPMLVERTLQRKWKAAIQATTSQRLAAIDDLLWTYAEESFLPHASAAEGDPDLQPVWLTIEDDNPNGAAVRFFIDGADPLSVLEDPQKAPSERAMILFDGRDEEALQTARAQFRSLREKGYTLSYWRQNDDGRWEKKA